MLFRAYILLVFLTACLCEIKIRAVTDPVGIVGESPIWDPEEQLLYYVGLLEGTVYVYCPRNGFQNSIHIGDRAGPILPIRGKKNQFIVGVGKRLMKLYWDPRSTSGEYKLVKTRYVFEPDKPKNAINDGKADAKGRIWIMTSSPFDPPFNVVTNRTALYTIGDNCQLRKAYSPTTKAHLTWNSDNTIMYFMDIWSYRLLAFDYNITTGTIANRRIVYNFSKYKPYAFPDGLTVDTNDNLWIAVYNTSRILNLTPEGKLIRKIKLSVSQVLAVRFGGKNLDVLYATTGRYKLTEEDLEEQKDAGAVFEITGLGVQGIRRNRKINGRCYEEESSYESSE